MNLRSLFVIICLFLAFGCSDMEADVHVANRIALINEQKLEDILRYKAGMQSEMKRIKNESNSKSLEEIDDKVEKIIKLIYLVKKDLNQYSNHEKFERIFEEWQTVFNRLIVSDYKIAQDYEKFTPIIAREFILYDILDISKEQFNDYALSIDKYYPDPIN
ncbi:hypothetical protein [Fulvivirga lutea]|uniref:Uncharacterized protein n=1 Tax=Fulvivirga lutea TaxID=2810512 RepID=A0A975A1F2_9BACT|nr:hypothetical protein [Fulvivirga lutea]QSE98241.1 hypothetical protein JR347_03945 [Fulvivirga lutea]